MTDPARGHFGPELEALTSEIDRLESEIAPVVERLKELRVRKRALIGAAAANAARKVRDPERREALLAEARMFARQSCFARPGNWQQQLADKFELSTRHVRRLLKEADIIVDPYR